MRMMGVMRICTRPCDNRYRGERITTSEAEGAGTRGWRIEANPTRAHGEDGGCEDCDDGAYADLHTAARQPVRGERITTSEAEGAGNKGWRVEAGCYPTRAHGEGGGNGTSACLASSSPSSDARLSHRAGRGTSQRWAATRGPGPPAG